MLDLQIINRHPGYALSDEDDDEMDTDYGASDESDDVAEPEDEDADAADGDEKEY